MSAHTLLYAIYEGRRPTAQLTTGWWISVAVLLAVIAIMTIIHFRSRR